MVKRLCGGCLLVWVLFCAGASKPDVIFRVHVQAEGQGLSENQAFPVQLYNPEEVLYVNALPDISEVDIVEAEAWTSEEAGQAVRLKFTPHGTKKLNALTSQHLGRTMVVFLNGRVVYSAIIDLTLSGGVLILPRGVEDAEVTLLQKQIKRNTN